MGNGISGNLETAIILDVSGVRTGAQRGVEALQMFESAGDRLGGSLADISSRSSDLTDNLARAASMIELLTAKMVAAESRQSTISRKAGGMLFGDIMASTQPTFGDRMAGVPGERQRKQMEANAAENLRISRLRASQQRQIDDQMEAERSQELAALRDHLEERLTLEARYDTLRIQQNAAVSRQMAQDEQEERDRTFADLRRDIEERAAVERAAADDAQQRQEQRARSAYRAEQRVRADAARFNAGANPSNPLRTTPGNISERFRATARDAVLWERGRVAAEQATNAVQRMRGMLNPMVAMETRLANEAREFREQLDLAVRAGIMQVNQAEELTAQFQQQNQLLLQQARQQQAGFLGMRRFGFAAQQAGYAIEDAASVWGTMGLSGAFRAGANNLTAMAATAGPAVGVAVSLAAAAAAIGLHLWESAEAAKESKEAEEKLAKERERMMEIQERLIDNEQRLRDIRRAESGSDISAIYQGQREDAKKREAQLREDARLAPLRAAEARAAQLREGIQLLSASFVRPTGPMTKAELDRQQQQQEDFRQAREDLAKTEKEIERLQKAEQEHLKRMEDPATRLAEREKERQLAFSESLRIRNTGIAKALGPEAQESQRSLAIEMQDLERQRLALVNARYTSEVEMLDAMERHQELADKQVAVAERMAKLREAGRDAEKEVNNTILGRFEALNPELKFQNDILRTRTEINKKIEEGIRAGEITQQEAARYRAELERIFKIETANREADTRLNALKKRETSLEQQLQANSREATVMSGTLRGSDEAAKILEQERLRQMQKNDQQPVVDELQKVRAEMKRLREFQERAAKENPVGVAAFF